MSWENGRTVWKSVFKMKSYSFADETNGSIVQIEIPEMLKASFGMYIWPGAPVLADFVWKSRNEIKGKRVLELGAGTALPGLVAGKVGAKLTLSDGAHLPDCLNNCRRSLEVNNIQADVVPITWGQFGSGLLNLGPVDIILGSDCFYDSKDFEDILVTVAYLLEKNPKAEFWTTYQERSPDRCIAHLLKKWKLTSKFVHFVELKKLETSSQEGDGHLEGSQPCHTITLYKIWRDR